jgi:hypothetical protein
MKPPKEFKWLIVSLVVLGLAYLYPIFFAWSGFYCWTEEIGLDTGRKRSFTNILWISAFSKESPTWLSDTLNTPDSLRETRWKPVNTTSPGVSFSPHYNYHGALAQITELEMCCDRLNLSPNARLLLAEALINRWRRDGDYRGAGSLILRPLNRLQRRNEYGNPLPDTVVKNLVESVKDSP